MPKFYVHEVKDGSIASGPETRVEVKNHVAELPLMVGVSARFTRLTEEEAKELLEAKEE